MSADARLIGDPPYEAKHHMGLEEFSMHPGQLLQVRDRLASLDCKSLRRAAPALFRSHTRDDVEARLLEVIQRQAECPTQQAIPL